MKYDRKSSGFTRRKNASFSVQTNGITDRRGRRSLQVRVFYANLVIKPHKNGLRKITEPVVCFWDYLSFTVPSKQTTSVAGTKLFHEFPLGSAFHSSTVPWYVMIVRFSHPPNA